MSDSDETYTEVEDYCEESQLDYVPESQPKKRRIVKAPAKYDNHVLESYDRPDENCTCN